VSYATGVGSPRLTTPRQAKWRGTRQTDRAIDSDEFDVFADGRSAAHGISVGVLLAIPFWGAVAILVGWFIGA
jgi:hypothetical protein